MSRHSRPLTRIDETSQIMITKAWLGQAALGTGLPDAISR